MAEPLRITYPQKDNLHHLEEIKVRTIESLQEWNLPSEVVQAGSWLPMIEQDPAIWETAILHLPEHTQTLIRIWQELELSNLADRTAQPSAAILSLKLRRLLRLAYLDMSVAILAVANHIAQLQVAHSSANYEKSSLWQECEMVFLPLLEMLGIWNLRRAWVDACAEQIDPEIFRRFSQGLHHTETQRIQGFEVIRENLFDWAANRIQVRCTHRYPKPGSLTFLQRNEQTPDIQFNQVTVEVETSAISDCYTLLEWAHQLGMPIQGRFLDHIAYAKPNGYRALHTRVMGRHEDVRLRNLIVEVRIFTPEMRLLNEMGVIAARYLDTEKYKDASCWWNKSLQQPDLQAAIRSHPIDISSSGNDLIYAFTPGGEAKLLPNHSTALDFAYGLHTEIGHHIRQVYVNGVIAPPSTELNNGDLVRLSIDRSVRPSPAWLQFVHSTKTRTKIRRALSANRQQIHPGRRLIDRFLKSLEESDHVVFMQPKLEKYLSLAAQEYSLGTVNRLYSAIVAPENSGPRISVDRLVAQILEAEFAEAIIYEDGRPVVTYPYIPFDPRARLRFCPACKPAPDAPIVIQRQRTRGLERLVVHRRPLGEFRGKSRWRFFGIPNNRKCINSLSNEELVSGVRWKSIPRESKSVDLWALAEDRPRLVGEILELVYKDPNYELVHLNASTDESKWADIVLSLRCDPQSNLSELSRAITRIEGVSQVETAPRPTPYVTALRSREGGELVNPYSVGSPVEDPSMFFGREEEIRTIRTALTSEQPIRVITLEGPFRSGKSSLALVLPHQLRNPSLHHVYVDLQTIAMDPSPGQLYHQIGRQIWRDLSPDLEKPIQLMGFQGTLTNLNEPTGTEFFSFLTAVQENNKSNRWLIVLDEFNVLVEGCKNKQVFTQLRAIATGASLGIHFLLILSRESYLHSPLRAKSLYEVGIPIDLDLLDNNASRLLITEPLKGFVDFDEGIVNQIVREMRGSPYLINRFCYILVEHLKSQSKRRVTQSDIEQVRGKFLRDGATNFHFMERLIDPKAYRLLTEIARHQTETTKLVDIRDAARSAKLDLSKAEKIANFLARHRIIDFPTEEEQGVRISIRLFAEWLAISNR